MSPSLHPALGLAADIEAAAMAEGLKEPVEKDLRLPLFVTGDMDRRPDRSQLNS